jgi:hypothetical protein
MGSRLAALIVAVVLTAFPVPAQDVDRSPRKRSPKREVEALMSEGLPFAEKMLGEHGEFFPFGAVMLSSGLVRMVGAFDEREQPAPEEVLQILLEKLREGDGNEPYRACATFSAVRVRDPVDGQVVDAVHVGLEHQAGYCVDVFYPYGQFADGVRLGEAFARKRQGQVFDSCAAVDEAMD